MLSGIRIGSWHIDGARRRGHASDTYPVVRAAGTERAALTVFDAPALQLGSYPRRIFEIAETLKAVEHPGVIDVLNAGLLADGRPYVVTDVDGGVTLPQIVLYGLCLERSRALTIVRGICGPLIAAHDVGVVHGALDLENVFLVEEDDHYIKLLDWGIENAVFDEARRAGVECPPRVTCAAPEAALGLRSWQTDAYALGVLAYRLLLGRAPFEAETAVAVRAMQANTRPDPRELWPTIPASLEALLCELLAPDPRSRPSIRDVSERLAALTREEHVATPAGVLAPPEDEPAPVEHVVANDYDEDAWDVTTAPPADEPAPVEHAAADEYDEDAWDVTTAPPADEPAPVEHAAAADDDEDAWDVTTAPPADEPTLVEHVVADEYDEDAWDVTTAPPADEPVEQVVADADDDYDDYDVTLAPPADEPAPLEDVVDDDHDVTSALRRRALRWGIGMVACSAGLAAVLMFALRTSDAPTARRPVRPHAAARSSAASAAPVRAHPAAPPILEPVPPPSQAVLPTSGSVGSPPIATPVETARVVVERKPQATPRPAAVAVRASVPAEPPRAISRTAPTSDVEARELLTDYQRVGHALFELRQRRGEEATSALWQEFHELKIEPALATAQSRAAASATLRELRARIERQQGVEVSEACLNNPLADGCR